MLLQEIGRLRERLQTLETENASMNRKLHKQQWDVESRLAEIEMQVCGSDELSECGTDLKCFPENKESMI
jgi:predicted nuclease with TOPRIM domain